MLEETLDLGPTINTEILFWLALVWSLKHLSWSAPYLPPYWPHQRTVLQETVDHLFLWMPYAWSSGGAFPQYFPTPTSKPSQHMVLVHKQGFNMHYHPNMSVLLESPQNMYVSTASLPPTANSSQSHLIHARMEHGKSFGLVQLGQRPITWTVGCTSITWCKLNFDGLVNAILEVSGIGGIVRMSTGHTIAAFSSQFKFSNHRRLSWRRSDRDWL